jgi:hypothetical protein
MMKLTGCDAVENGLGVVTRNRSTASIDSGVVIFGEFDMELDDGLVVQFKGVKCCCATGDVRNWTNNGNVSCVSVFVLVGSTGEGALGYASLLNLYRAGWHQIAV